MESPAVLAGACLGPDALTSALAGADQKAVQAALCAAAGGGYAKLIPRALALGADINALVKSRWTKVISRDIICIRS